MQRIVTQFTILGMPQLKSSQALQEVDVSPIVVGRFDVSAALGASPGLRRGDFALVSFRYTNFVFCGVG